MAKLARRFWPAPISMTTKAVLLHYGMCDCGSSTVRGKYRCGFRRRRKPWAPASLGANLLYLELEHLLLGVAQLLEHARQLALRLWVLLGPLCAAHHLDHRRRPAHEDAAATPGRRHPLSQHLLGDVPDAAAPVGVRGLVNEVEDLKLAGVGGRPPVHLLLEQDVLLRHVGKDERHLGVVLSKRALAGEDLVDHLQHRRDARAARNHPELGVLVQLVRQLDDRALDLERVAHLEAGDVL
mmetsp:Transcript_40451/g.134813  ORF Transcript_40451/g.134813 Transcript_40451/m.134813 type:complete len:239 (+) Transcript_40451:92-808(+)